MRKQLTFDFTKEELGLAEKVACRFRSDVKEDMEMTALVTLWQKRDAFVEGDYPKNMYTTMFRACLDEFRTMFGRKGTGKAELRANSVGLNTEHHNVTSQLPEESTDLDIGVGIVMSKLNVRQRYIVERTGTGALKQDIADELGVTPGAISHQLKKIRRLFDAQLECMEV